MCSLFCTVAVLKARNNHISNQAFRKPLKIGDSCAWLYDKKYKTSVYSEMRVTSKSVGKRVCNVSLKWGQRLEIVVTRNAPQRCVCASKFAFFPVLTSNSLLRTLTDLSNPKSTDKSIVTNLFCSS